jgi:hypothetical protein
MTLFRAGTNPALNLYIKVVFIVKQFKLYQNYVQNFFASKVVLNRVNGWVNAPIVEHGTPLKK